MENRGNISKFAPDKKNNVGKYTNPDLPYFRLVVF